MKIEEVKLGSLFQKAIELTKDTLPSEQWLQLSEEEQDHLQKLHELCKKEPRKTYNFLIDFLKRRPTLPEALSLLTYNYLLRRKVKLADETIAFTYKHNSDNLLACVNYADLCLRKKKPEKVEEIFEGVFDLVDLYPEQKLFPMEGYRAFHTMLAHYFLAINDRERSEGHLLLASNINRNHPNVRILAKKILHRKR